MCIRDRVDTRFVFSLGHKSTTDHRHFQQTQYTYRDCREYAVCQSFADILLKVRSLLNNDVILLLYHFNFFFFSIIKGTYGSLLDPPFYVESLFELVGPPYDPLLYWNGLYVYCMCLFFGLNNFPYISLCRFLNNLFYIFVCMKRIMACFTHSRQIGLMIFGNISVNDAICIRIFLWY